MKSSRVDLVCTASVIDICRPDDPSLPQIGMSETQSTIHRRTPTFTDRYVHTQTHDQTGQEAAQHTIILEERAPNPLYNTHTIQSTSLDRNPPSFLPTLQNKSNLVNEKIKEGGRKELKKRKNAWRCNAFIQKKTRAGRTCRFVSQNTEEESAVKHDRQKRKHYARLMPPGFSSRASRSH